MGEEDTKDPSFSTLELPFLRIKPAATFMHSPPHPSGMATPPLQTLASVPFKWEEKPGKPRSCTDIIALPGPGPAKCLELPPCRTMQMLLLEPASKIAKMPSPTAVLDGPYHVGRPKFSSFRLFREAQFSFDSSSSCASPQSSVDVLVGKKSGRRKTRGFLGWTLRFKSGKKDGGGGSFGFSPSSSTTGCERVEGEMRRSGSFSSYSQAALSTHLWASMYESVKGAVPWKSTRKSKKEGLLRSKHGDDM